MAGVVSHRCRMCARSAYINRNGERKRYCGATCCENPVRLCQVCSSEFVPSRDFSGGTKYCSPDCLELLVLNQENRNRAGTCAWCSAPGVQLARFRGADKRRWPPICQECLEPVKHVVPRLKAHHVPHERVKEMIKNPYCPICGKYLLESDFPGGRKRPVLVVDHDHKCCPNGSFSCGKCVRGLICAGCNVAIGLLGDSPERARAMIDYLNKAILSGEKIN